MMNFYLCLARKLKSASLHYKNKDTSSTLAQVWPHKQSQSISQFPLALSCTHLPQWPYQSKIVLEDTRPLQSAGCHIKGTHPLVDSGTTMRK